MNYLDLLVLAIYFGVMIAIGVYSSRLVKEQEDYFMGGRSFGKLLQTFAAFGAGTGSSDPVNTARTTFTGGMSGMWSVMYWLFATPFYWITAVWFRRMRHLTTGDWFVERYESKAMGAAYCVFGISFYMLYGSLLFSAIGKVAAPLVEIDNFALLGQVYDIEYLLVPVIGLVVVVYGIMGGLRAAYFTDLIQGICIILLSVILIPYGLQALVERFGDPATDSIMDGFRYMHQQLPAEHFHIIGSTTSSEFPIQRIIAVVIINLIGVVVQPHFIATGGGSAKTETDARVGMVVGNFLKRLCTVGWVLTALIALALYADHRDLVMDPDRTWGVASRELLGPGLTGLMLACLLAALMSSVDAYMIVGSALVVRNIYAPYINPQASEAQCIRVGRMTGVITVAGGVLISLYFMDVFLQLQLTWIFPVLFAAPFWIGMYWRRATAGAAWCTVAFCALAFFLIPYFAPRLVPDLRTDPRFLGSNEIVETTTVRPAAPSAVQRRATQIAVWDEQHAEWKPKLVEAAKAYQEMLPELVGTADSDGLPVAADLDRYQRIIAQLTAVRYRLDQLGLRPTEVQVDDDFAETTRTGGQSIFWGVGVHPVDEKGNVLANVKPQPVGLPTKINDKMTSVVLAYDESVRLNGFGNFRLDFLLYEVFGMDLTKMANATLATMELPAKIVMPFLVMILLSLMTRSNSQEALDRYYAKMKTPVDPDPAEDQRKLVAAYADLEQFERKKLLPGTSLEFQRPTRTDVIGFVVCFAICFAIIGLVVWIGKIGA